MPAKKERANPKVGSEFIKRYKGKTYTLKVVKTDGKVAYELGDSVFKSPSTAAKSLTKGEVNGWTFWGIE